VTHLVVASTLQNGSSEKLDTARRRNVAGSWKVAIVDLKWLQDCVATEKLQSSDSYRLPGHMKTAIDSPSSQRDDTRASKRTNGPVERVAPTTPCSPVTAAALIDDATEARENCSSPVCGMLEPPVGPADGRMSPEGTMRNAALSNIRSEAPGPPSRDLDLAPPAASDFDSSSPPLFNAPSSKAMPLSPRHNNAQNLVRQDLTTCANNVVITIVLWLWKWNTEGFSILLVS
jgi:hypothetical protein